MKALIYIHAENEEFWVNLENKSGWVNMIISALLEESKKEYEYEKNEEQTDEPEVQATEAEDEGGVPIW